MLKATVELKAKRNSLHPWIYQRMIRRPARRVEPGMVVTVTSKEGAYVGRGFYNPKSTIGLRLLTENPKEQVDARLFHHRLARALDLRRSILRLEECGDSFRWVHGEADGLSGLIVDRLGEVVVIEPYSAGYRGQVLEWIAEAIIELQPGVKVMVRPDARTAKREGYDFRREAQAYPGIEESVLREHDQRMRIDLRTGHKTGFFLDQRDNRQALAALARDRRVVDCFSYTGGFSIAAKLAGAASVLAVDLDEEAIKVAEQNAKLNQVEVEFRHQDAFDFLRSLQQVPEEKVPEVLVLDPPKYASVKDEVNRARRMYGDLNRLGLQSLKNGGILLTCSCSGLISEQEFISIVGRSAAEAGVDLQIMKISGAAPDHPWATSFPEGRYLKAIFGRVIRRSSAPNE